MKYKIKIKQKGKRIEVDSQHCKVGSIYDKPYKKKNVNKINKL